MLLFQVILQPITASYSYSELFSDVSLRGVKGEAASYDPDDRKHDEGPDPLLSLITCRDSCLYYRLVRLPH
jgi:hypothetical protein